MEVKLIKKKDKRKRTERLVFCSFFVALILIVTLFSTNIFNLKYKVLNDKIKVATSNYKALSYDTTNYIYLSDISYLSKSTVKSGQSIRLDKNSNSGLINVNIEGIKKPFIKGISAWATSDLYYDLKALRDNGHNYQRFVTYLGVDASQTDTYYNSGVTFTIYTSLDGENWTEAYKTGTLKGWDNAQLVNIDISKANYLRLYAYENGNSWYSHWYDDAVYADAKLITDNYQENKEVDSLIKPISYYDKIIKEGTGDNELTLLQREFVNNVGYDILQAYAAYSSSYRDIFEWLMSDQKVLEAYLLGGAPDGNYGTSLTILNELYKTYQKDLTDPVYGDLYLKMMISISLTHSAPVGLWVTGAPNDPLDSQGSEAIDRYAIYKKMHQDNLLDNKLFESLSVEEMRFVMNNIIDDEEIMWLNNYATLNKSKDPYTYVNYTSNYNYFQDKYALVNNKSFYNNKIRTKANIPYNFLNGMLDANGKEHLISYGDVNKPKLWVVFEEGGVCGAISKVGSNINGSYGAPSTVVSQPGHAAYIVMSFDNKGNKVWNLYNDVYGWGQSGKTEKLSTRMPNGWGTGSYSKGYAASYILLSQAALNDYENYVRAEKVVMRSHVYNDDLSKERDIYEEALKIQKINFDAWLGLINNYLNDESITNLDLLKLVQRITTDLKFYPLPMYEALQLIEPRLTGADHAIYINLLNKALTDATKALDTDVLQPGPTKQVANYLLQNNDTVIATFSFDGERANEIVLSDRYEGNGVVWDYSLDSRNWTRVSGMSVKLSEEEIASISDELDIAIRIVGALDTVYDIDITKGVIPPSLYNNDLENRLIGASANMEWRFKESDAWTSYGKMEPDLSGDKEIYVRLGYSGNALPSEAVKYTFTSQGETEKDHYIPLSRVGIHSYSSDEKSHSNGIENLLDGNINTIWHSLWNGNDKEKYVVLEINRLTYLSAFEYVPRPDGGNGNVFKARISVSQDGTNWEVVVPSTSWSNNANRKRVTFTKPMLAKYVKFEGIETSGSYISAAMINLFEDTTLNKTLVPVGTISYSTTILTNQDVTATLIVPDDVVVTNNNGSKTYTFKENGEFTFEFEKDDLKGEATARVNWINKEKPTAEISYNISTLTNQNVVATLVNSNKHLNITNNNGSNTYTFSENGEFTFYYVDDYGNEGSTKAKVDWIDKIKPTGKVLYSKTTPTNTNITATLETDEETTVLNIESKTYTFTENGEYTFWFTDKAGNVGSVIAKVDWIDKVAPLGTIKYSTTETTIGSVTVTLESNEKIIITNNDGKNTYTFEENGEFTFEYQDLAGNKGKTTAKVDWIIDSKEDVKVEIFYSPTKPTNGEVTATLVNTTNNIKITNNEGKNTYTFKDNGTFTFQYETDDGLKGNITAIVDWIDKIAPIATITYSKDYPTNGEVIATLTANEDIIVINNDGKNTYTFKDNGEFTFEYQDLAGNMGKITAKVDWIDKALPIIEIKYSTLNKTNKDVIATIESDKEITILNNNGEKSYTFKDNGEFTFDYIDKAGNKGQIIAKVDWIDKTPPTGILTYSAFELTNKDVVVTLKTSEKVTIKNNNGENIYTFKENGTFEFIFQDEAGNIGRITAKVDWIDKVLPTVNVKYSIPTETTMPVVVTLESNEKLKVLNNEGKSTYTFTENGEFTFEYQDLAGNKGKITAKVDWINQLPLTPNDNKVEIPQTPNVVTPKPNIESPIIPDNSKDKLEDDSKEELEDDQKETEDKDKEPEKEEKPTEEKKDSKDEITNESVSKTLTVMSIVLGMIALISIGIGIIFRLKKTEL